MSRTTIDRLSINLSYTEPARHWRYERELHNFSRIIWSAARRFPLAFHLRPVLLCRLPWSITLFCAV